jgi:hypothetical protein
LVQLASAPPPQRLNGRARPATGHIVVTWSTRRRSAAGTGGNCAGPSA